MLKFTLAITATLALLVAGCSDDDGSDATATQPAGATATTQASSTPPAVTPTTVGTSAPPVDGTIPAEGVGSTDPVTLKSDPDPMSGIAVLTDVRVGAHPEEGGWDRIVFEFDGERPGGMIEYVDSATQCGSGDTVDLPGEGTLEVRFDATQAHTEAGQPTVDPRVITGPGNVILESRQTCDFEGMVVWHIGVESEQRMNVRTLSNPSRIVIDIKQ